LSVRRLAVLAVLVIVTLSLLGTAASAKPRRYWCARAAALQKQIATTVPQSDALAEHREALAEQFPTAGLAPTVVLPLYRLTPEEDYASAQERCTKGR
jgi:hypothetical protein